MLARTLRFRSRVPVPRSFVWSGYSGPGIFERLTPAWQGMETLEVDGTIQPGDRREMRLRLGPFGLDWVALHGEYEEGYLFTDRQVRGPFNYWLHRHRFHDDGDACILEDEVTFALPLPAISHPIGLPIAVQELRRLFHFRHFTTFHDFREHYALREHRRREVIVRGYPESVARQLVAYLELGGHRVVPAGSASGGADVVIELEGDERQGLRAHVNSLAEPDGSSARAGRMLASAMIPDRSFAARLHVLGLLLEAPDRPLEWSTVDDFVAAVHRAVLGLQSERQLFVSHPRQSSARELAGFIGVPESLVARLPLERWSWSDGGPASLPHSVRASGRERESRSRYRDLSEVATVVLGWE